jgi:hypothetical protein
MANKKGKTTAQQPSEDPPADPPSDPEDPPDPPTPPPAEIEDDPQARLFATILSAAITEALERIVGQVQRASATQESTKYPKAKDPSMFNGRNRKGLRTWIGENEICFRTAPNLYRTDTSKVMFAGSFLEGDAKSWFTDYFKDPANIPTFMDDWALFIIELQRNFGLEDEIGAAEEELRKLTMNDRDHATYFVARFRAVVSNLQDTWNDRTLRNQLYAKLAPRLRSQFVSSGTPVPSTLEPLITTVERFDRAYWANFELDRTMTASAGVGNVPRDRIKPSPPEASSSRLTAKPPPKPVSAIPNPRPKLNTHLTEQGKLTDTERQRRMDTGACMYCGELGHFAKDCRKKLESRPKAANSPSTQNTPAKQSARATVSAESEESSESGKE